MTGRIAISGKINIDSTDTIIRIELISDDQGVRCAGLSPYAGHEGASG